MKKGFTLIEMVIVLLVVGILMAATMRFGSNRIVDLRAQSLKEQFIGYYNELYSQNMTSSFRDGKKYQQLTMTFETDMWYQVDWGEKKLSPFVFRGLMLDSGEVWSVQIVFTPYVLWCPLVSDGNTGNVFTFQMYVAENAKQYCFEIKSETCKLIEQRCDI